MVLAGFRKPILLVLLIFLMYRTCSHGFSMDFYALSCPTVELIVRDAVRSAASSDPSVPAKLLRLLFHDCFVEGCDGSVLLEGNKTERSDPANTSLGGFQVIDAAKSSLEVFCPFTVSCADVLALAARDAVFLVGGPLIQIPTGRRDGRVSAVENVRPNIVDTTFTLDQMIALFSSKGLSLQDIVVLSGAHTIGSAHCSAFSDRLQVDLNGKLKPTDSSLDESYAAQLAKKCLQVAALKPPNPPSTMTHKPRLCSTTNTTRTWRSARGCSIPTLSCLRMIGLGRWWMSWQLTRTASSGAGESPSLGSPASGLRGTTRGRLGGVVGRPTDRG